MDPVLQTAMLKFGQLGFGLVMRELTARRLKKIEEFAEELSRRTARLEFRLRDDQVADLIDRAVVSAATSESAVKRSFLASVVSSTMEVDRLPIKLAYQYVDYLDRCSDIDMEALAFISRSDESHAVRMRWKVRRFQAIVDALPFELPTSDPRRSQVVLALLNKLVAMQLVDRAPYGRDAASLAQMRKVSEIQQAEDLQYGLTELGRDFILHCTAEHSDGGQADQHPPRRS